MKIDIDKNSIYIDGKPFFVNSGEVHYFRIPKKFWNIHLKRAKEAGLNTISSYIPWCFHERTEGNFDFSDVIEFIELVKKFGFYFIARIGPVSNAELVYEGLPKWLCENYPEVFVKGRDLGSLPHATLVAYHNPTFLKFVERWYSNVCQVIKKYQITSNSGNIILLQLCNEIGMVHWLHKAVDYSNIARNMYCEFLKKKYKNIDELNKNYKTDYKSFDEIEQPSDNIAKESLFQVYHDWMNFYSDFYGRYYHFLYKIIKSFGIEIPVVANIPQFYDFDVRGRGVYSPMTTLMFREFTKYVPMVIFGGAYQMRRLDYDNFHDVLITTEVVRMISSKNVPSICCELQTGKLSDRPKIYPSDVELNLKLSTSSGLAGVNGYMFSGGINSEGSGAFGVYHEWQAPVSSDGKPREHFVPLRKFGLLIKSFGNLISKTQKYNDITIGFYAPYYNTELLKGDFVNKLDYLRTTFFFDGFARLLQLAGYSYDIIDLEKVSLEELEKHKILFIFSLDFMDRTTQQKLYEYVSNGGTLIINPKLPTKDLKGVDENILIEKIGIKISKEIETKWVYFSNKEIFLVGGTVQVFEDVKKGEILTTTKEGFICGFTKKVNKGEVVVLGFGINHTFDYHINLVDEIFKLVGVKPYILVEPFGEINVVMRKNKDYGFLFIFNFHEVDKFVSLKLCLPGEKNITAIPSKNKMLLKHRTAIIVPLNISLTEGVVIKYSSLEILKYSISKKYIEFYFNDNMSNGEVCLQIDKKPKTVKYGDIKPKFNFKNGILKIFISEISIKQKLIIER